MKPVLIIKMIEIFNSKSNFCHRIYIFEYACPNNEAVSAKVVTTRNGIEKDRRVIANGDGIILTDTGVKTADIKRNICTG